MSKKKSNITVTDCFCGAGGSSQGIKEATESLGMNYGTDVQVEYALNHWDLAIETHNTNFPTTKHDCTDISACDPRRYPSTDILIGSPECTNHSVAKGQERVKAQLKLYETGAIDPAQERSRQTMWDIPRFAEYHNYRAIIVENVVDARTWVQYPAWIMAMQLLGYKYKEVYLNSMFCWPTPQSRDRMYVVFWKKGMKAPDLEIRPKAYCPKCEKDIEARQRWKNGRIFGKYKRQYDYACADCNTEVTPYYYAAFNVIDWSDLGTRIGDRDKPLCENTLRRIQYGLDKYCQPFTIDDKLTTGIDFRVNPVTGKIPTIHTDPRMKLITPFITLGEHGAQLNVRAITDSLQTQATRQTMGLCTPFITESGYNGKTSSAMNELHTQTTHQNKDIVFPFMVENKGMSNSRRIDSPLGAITTKNHLGLCSFITENHRTGNTREITEALNGITAGGIKSGLVTTEALQAFLSYNYNGTQTSHISEPVDTISTKDRVALITGKVRVEDCYYRMLYIPEIQRGMGFSDGYVILGNAKQQTKLLGNAVTPSAEKLLGERVFQIF